MPAVELIDSDSAGLAAAWWGGGLWRPCDGRARATLAGTGQQAVGGRTCDKRGSMPRRSRSNYAAGSVAGKRGSAPASALPAGGSRAHMKSLARGLSTYSYARRRCRRSAQHAGGPKPESRRSISELFVGEEVRREDSASNRSGAGLHIPGTPRRRRIRCQSRRQQSLANAKKAQESGRTSGARAVHAGIFPRSSAAKRRRQRTAPWRPKRWAHLRMQSLTAIESVVERDSGN